MWVYQETKTNAAALVPTLPEDTAGESLAEKEAMTPVSKPLAELPPQKAPRRKPFQASRDCILLAAAYLFGTLWRAFCRRCATLKRWKRWPIIWTAGAECLRRPVQHRRWDCSGQSWLSSSGRRQCSSCWGSRQWGRCLSFCLRCYTGQAPACSRRSFWIASGQNSSFSFCSQPAFRRHWRRVRSVCSVPRLCRSAAASTPSLLAEAERETAVCIRQEHGSWWGNSPYWRSVSARSAVRPPALYVLQIV